MPNTKNVTIITMGCSKNLVDSEQLLRQFGAIGYNVQHDSESPKGDVVIINTCGFIGDAKEESIDTILKYARLRKEGNINKLFVMGCLSERYLKELTEEIPEVDHFYGKFDWKNVLTDLGETYNEKLRLERCLTTPSHYAYIKISEGCNRTCSYCAIPIITGQHKSRPKEEILDEILLLLDKGVKEFQLIAQDLSYYGKDLYKSSKLSELVEQISFIPGVEWLRLHYTYPHDFPVDLLRVIRERPNVCSYLDMALQHISDPMLTKMRRNINREQTIELIKLIRQEVPGIHLRTTFMVGHPGETEEYFQELCDFVKQTRFERMGAFIYSEEEGTYAAKNYKDEIPQEVKQSRLDKLMLIQQKISQEINTAKIGQVLRVIIDREEPEFYVGRTEFDSPDVDPEVLILKEKSLMLGQFYNIKITSSESYDLFGCLA